MSLISRIRKIISYLTNGDDVWGGWEDNVDYEVNGKDGNDKLYGYTGDDILSGDDGDDEVYGGYGKDKLYGGRGKDKLFGGDGDDEIDGGDGDDEAFGGEGNDKIKGGKGNDKLFGGNGDDAIDGEDGDDTIFGEGGRNKLRGGRGRDLIFGGDDNDEISGGEDEDTLYGNGGDDFIQGDAHNDIIFGGDGNDTLEGNSGDDTVFGEADNDTIAGNAGNDYLNGGTGNDTIDGNAGNDYIYGFDGDDNLRGSGENDTLDGGSGNDSLIGGLGNDTLYGEDGDDTLVGVETDETGVMGANSVDIYVGGAGNDVYVLGNATGVFYDDGDATTDGVSDYALIKDFNRFEDTIQLNGTANDYVVTDVPSSLDSTYSGMNVAGIYQDTDGNGGWDNTDELIAVVEYLSPESVVLDAVYFQYTDDPNQESWHPANDSDWELVFSDEFDVSFIDSNKWSTKYSHNVYGGRTNPWNGEHQAYVGDDEVIDGVEYDAFDFNNGVLSIVSQKVDQPLTLDIEDAVDGFDAVKTFDYTSGILNSDDNYAFTYGYMEMRAQVAAGQGLWPAFWMLPTHGGWPPEIDIMESLGHRTDTVFNSLHYTDENGEIALEKGEQTFSGMDFSAGFHTFGVEWSETNLTWFVDGQALYSIDHDIPDVSMYLLANMAVGGYWPGSPDETTPETSAFEIDYIRVYQDQAGTLHGGAKDDSLSKALGNIAGEAGNDILQGGYGDNTLLGGSGDDTLTGTDIVNAGLGEIDTLTGGSGADIFVLGEAGQIFYDDGDGANLGRSDYALITDFDLQQDTIQLVGNSLDYQLGISSDGSSTELWYLTMTAQDELIAVLDQQIINNFGAEFSFLA